MRRLIDRVFVFAECFVIANQFVITNQTGDSSP
jgi:hypothetical protein